MSQDVSKLISGMLSNPEALKNLMNIMAGASQSRDDSSIPPQGEIISGAVEEMPDLPQSGNLEASVQSMLSALNRTDDRRITLLTALKPYLSSSRANGVDRAIRILKLSKLSEVLRNER